MMEEKGLSLMENSKNEERGLDELIEPLIIETSDYKKMRLDRTIYTQFKLFNDFAEIRNSNRKEKRSGDEILKLNIPFKIMNHIVCLLWEGHPCSIIYTTYKNYRHTFKYLGFQTEPIKMIDKFIELIQKNSDFTIFKNGMGEYKKISVDTVIYTEYGNLFSSDDIYNTLLKKDKYVTINMFQSYGNGITYHIILYLSKYNNGKATWIPISINENSFKKMAYIPD